MSSDARCTWRTRLLVLVGAAVVLLFQLGGRGLNEPDEARYAEVARQMMVSGDYLVPHLNGVPHLSKPPVTYWLIAGSFRAFGVNEFAARLPMALAAAVALIGIYLVAESSLGCATGAWSAVVIVSSGLFFFVGRLVNTDMLLTCFVVWSVWALWRWYLSPDRGFRKLVWFYVFLGIGFMVKGPVAVVLPLFAAAGLRWQNPSLRLLHLCWGRGAVIFFAIVVPWYVAVTWHRPELWEYFLGREVVGRVVSNVHGRAKPWWYFFAVLPAAFLPWTPWLLVARGTLRGESGRRGDVLRMCAAWAGLGFVLFSISRSKLATYMLPLLPPLGVLVAVVLMKLKDSQGEARTAKIVRWCGGLMICLLLGLMAVIVVRMRQLGHKEIFLDLTLAFVTSLGISMSVVGIVNKSVQWVATGAATAVLLMFHVLLWAVPSLEHNLGGITSAKELAARIQKEETSNHTKVVMCRTTVLGLTFYLQQPVYAFQPTNDLATTEDEHVFEYAHHHGSGRYVIRGDAELRRLLEGPERVFCVTSTKGSRELTEMVAMPMYRLEEVGRWVLWSNQPAKP